MPLSHAAARGSILMKTPNWRQQAGRRRLIVLCAVVGLAVASGLVGSLIHPAHPLSSRTANGPFSYFPSE
ncbi:hypothetical protein [Phenylobacterium sp.]|uniref:hypothetical protein n=1 Tax=Phenylobacterium sp. TaxID=1871053 RepID=UPI0011FB00B5|nr:hypothetical protein [Phenylobacterium sp.]THD53997.1 MAG: hypothetical protein E8A12_17915 [Phenylobacterium sp.]